MDITTVKETTTGFTRTFDINDLCFDSTALTAGVEVGAVIDVGPATRDAEVVLAIAGGGTVASTTTILIEGSAVVGMSAPVALVSYVYTNADMPADDGTTLTVPFTNRPDRTDFKVDGTPEVLRFIRVTVTLGGSDAFTASCWLTKSKSL